MQKKVVKKIEIKTETKKVEVDSNRAFFRKLFKIISCVLILAIIAVLSLYGYGKIKESKLNKVQSTFIPSVIKKILLNSETKITSVENIQEVSGVYKFILKLDTKGKKTTDVIYMTKDGKIVFTQGINVDNIKSSPSATPAATK